MFECSGTWKEANHRQHKLDKGKQLNEHHPQHPFRGPTASKAHLYTTVASNTIEEWLTELTQRQTIKPTQEQFTIVQRVAHRLQYEMRQEQNSVTDSNSSNEEPLLDLIHGFPGTGKREAITWLK